MHIVLSNFLVHPFASASRGVPEDALGKDVRYHMDQEMLLWPRERLSIHIGDFLKALNKYLSRV
jgi:hypothetical protein